jgi:hypothetical protein
VTLAYDPKEDENILQQIRARVSSIPTSSPYLEAQKETERAAKQAALEAEAPLLAATAGNTPAPDAGPTSPEG